MTRRVSIDPAAAGLDLSARRVAPPLVALIALGVLVAFHREEVGRALSRASAADVLALTGLHLLALVLRAQAWGMCVARAGRPVPARELHRASAARFLADTVVPTYVGLFVRVGLLRRWLGPRAPTVAQMVTADGVMLLIEAVMVIGALVAVTPALGIAWWIPVVAVAALVAAYGVALRARARFAHRSFADALGVLELSPAAARLAVVLFVVVALQPVRYAIALRAVGVDADALEALLAFIATNVFGALPIGPGPSSVGGLATALHGAGTGALTAAAVLLAATAILAAASYVLVAGAEAVAGGSWRR